MTLTPIETHRAVADTRSALDAIRTQLTQLREGRAWKALGYRSATEMFICEFPPEVRALLPKPDPAALDAAKADWAQRFAAWVAEEGLSDEDRREGGRRG